MDVHAQQAYADFENEDYAAARERYRAIVQAYPEDSVARVMVLRCDQALAQGAPAELSRV